jgi:hypothetical protein
MSEQINFDQIFETLVHRRVDSVLFRIFSPFLDSCYQVATQLNGFFLGDFKGAGNRHRRSRAANRCAAQPYKQVVHVSGSHIPFRTTRGSHRTSILSKEHLAVNYSRQPVNQGLELCGYTIEV